jgi:hypothetical protein
MTSTGAGYTEDLRVASMDADRRTEGSPSPMAVLALAVPVGLGLWTFLAVAQSGGSPFIWFSAATCCAAVVLGSALHRRGLLVGFGLVLAPLVAAPWTASRGDNDGLWVLVFPLIVMLGLFASGAALLADLLMGQVAAWRAMRQKMCLALSGARWIAVGAGVLCTLALALWLPTRLPDPWPQLENALDLYELPRGFEERAVRRSGDVLCDSSCGPRLTLVMTTDLSPAAACDALNQSMTNWTLPRTLDWLGRLGSLSSCSGTGTVETSDTPVNVDGFVGTRLDGPAPSGPLVVEVTAMSEAAGP